MEGERNRGHPGHAQWVIANNPLNSERMGTENSGDEMEDDNTGDNEIQIREPQNELPWRTLDSVVSKRHTFLLRHHKPTMRALTQKQWPQDHNAAVQTFPDNGSIKVQDLFKCTNDQGFEQ